ncbi:hypothetical protein C2W64_00573 [Brevibacillus laterosporus]|nr:hypothetical protein C2W64_00573 [Brevibacillus laterosporus]
MIIGLAIQYVLLPKGVSTDFDDTYLDALNTTLIKRKNIKNAS